MANLYWDADGDTSTSLGGTGIWDLTSNGWRTSGGSWSNTSNMVTSRRYLPPAILLNNNKVLVAGGNTNTAELYNPSTNLWETVPVMSAQRSYHTAVALSDGRVHVLAGQDSTNTPLATAQLYTPSTNTWATAAAITTARASHTATLLTDGRVFVTGGRTTINSTPVATAFIYNPSTNTWAAAGSMTTARYGHVAERLTDGRVLIAGGFGATSPFRLKSAEVYNPSNNTWSTLPDMSVERHVAGSILLSDGRVLVAGGSSVSGYESSVEIYNPSTNTWTNTGSMSIARANFKLISLSGGRVLVIGGSDGVNTASVEIYDPSTGVWASPPNMAFARAGCAACTLSDGRIFVAGGSNSDGRAAEIFNPEVGTLRAWLNTGNDIAYFLNQVGTVTLANNVSIGGVFSDIDGYVINTTGSNIINLSTHSTANITTGTFTLNAPVSGSYDLIKSGSGNLVLSSNNTLTGSVKVQSGNLIFNSTASLPEVLGVELAGGSFYSYANLSRDVLLTSGTLFGNSTITSNITVASSLLSVIRPDSGNLTLANLVMSGRATFIAVPGAKIITSNLTNALSSTTSRFIDIKTSGSFSSGYSEVISAENSSAELSDFNLNSSGILTNQVLILQGDGKTVGIIIKNI